MVVYSREKMKAILVSHNRWLNDEEGACRADLSYVNTSIAFAGLKSSCEYSMRGVNFLGATLKHCNFTRLDLRNCNFAGADLQWANFTNCNLKGANFRNANLDGTFFNGANLCGCEFHNAVLNRTNLTGAKFTCELASAEKIHNVSIEKENLHLLCLNKSFLLKPIYRDVLLGLHR